MSKYQYDATRIAKQLCYSEETINAIREAKSDNEVTRILHSARDKAEDYAK